MHRCLLVDDSAVVRKVAARILATIGYQVLEVESAGVAVASTKSFYPDVVLIDWCTPGSCSIEAITGIRALMKNRQPRVIYLITDYEELAIRRAIAAGADSYMMKPFNRLDITEHFAKLSIRAAA